MALEGYFVDANLLVLMVVGRNQRTLIGRHRKLKENSESDYDVLTELLIGGKKIFVTPNTLTETSNLLGYGPSELRTRLYETSRFLIHASEEIVVKSIDATNADEFVWLGLTDAALVLSATRETPVVTADL